MWEQLLIALVVTVISFLIRPKPKKEKPAAVEDLKLPTAEAGRPIPVLFGRITTASANVLWYGHKAVRTYEIET